MQCLLCKKEESKLANSHIFPRGFFRDIGTVVRTVRESGEMGRKLNTAIYDSEILCHSCEKITAQIDTYAIKILRDKQQSFEIVIPNTEGKLYVFENVDKLKLRAFIASILWRVSVSKQKELQNLSIGSIYEERIGSDLLNNGKFEYIDFCLYYFTDPLHSAFFVPEEIKIPPKDEGRGDQNVNGWLLRLPFMYMRVSLDKRNHPDRMYLDISPELSGKVHNILASTSLQEDSQYRLMAWETLRHEEEVKQLIKAFYLDTKISSSKRAVRSI